MSLSERQQFSREFKIEAVRRGNEAGVKVAQVARDTTCTAGTVTAYPPD